MVMKLNTEHTTNVHHAHPSTRHHTWLRSTQQGQRILPWRVLTCPANYLGLLGEEDDAVPLPAHTPRPPAASRRAFGSGATPGGDQAENEGRAATPTPASIARLVNSSQSPSG